MTIQDKLYGVAHQLEGAGTPAQVVVLGSLQPDFSLNLMRGCHGSGNCQS